MERDWQEDIRINRFKLEENCEAHASIHSFYAEMHVEYLSELKQLEKQLKLMTGEKELKFRKNPPDDIKVTNDTIKAWLATDKDLNKLEDSILTKEKEVNIARAALGSLEHKRSELNNLVSLYQSNYFSKPTGQRRDNNRDNARKAVRNNLKKED